MSLHCPTWRWVAAAALVLGVAAAARGEDAVPPAAAGPPAPSCETTAAHEGKKPDEAAPAAWPPGLLMDGLESLNLRKPMDDMGLRAWGFIEGGFTGRLSGGQESLPLRGFEARRPDNIRLQQLRLTIDRPYDAAKSVDVGGRIDGLFGGDAMLTRSPGLFEHAGHETSDAWADLTQMYLQLWLKTGPDSGLEITGGKFVTTHGAEVIDATGNPLFTHSYLFNFAIPFTHTGLKFNYIFSPNVSAYAAVVRGWEVFEDNNDSMSFMAGTALSSKEQLGGHARAQLALNVITGPEQAGNVSNYRTVSDVAATYWWTEKLSQTLNFDYGVEQGVPGLGAAHWYGVAHYLVYAWNDYVSPTHRVEWFRDDGGSRTGVAANFYETTFGVTVTPWPKDRILKNLSVRPELRWDWADRVAFGGDRFNQLTFGFDILFRF